jgi:hypothetical protein
MHEYPPCHLTLALTDCRNAQRVGNPRPGFCWVLKTHLILTQPARILLLTLEKRFLESL